MTPVTTLPNVTRPSWSRPWKTSAPPKSGTAGTYAGQIGAGDLLWDAANEVMWVNEGTKASPYYTPVTPDQAGLVSIVERNWNRSDGHALAATDTSTLLRNGWTVLGDGVHEGDSGAVVQAATEAAPQGAIRLTTSDAVGDIAALSTPVVSNAGIYQPDANKLGIIDVRLTNVSAITGRIVGIGFVGLAPVGFTDPVTGATTVLTLVDDDLALLLMDDTMTDADRIVAAHNKSDAAATQDISSDTALNTGVNMAAAGTEQRFRVEIDDDGTMRGFIDKALVFTESEALDADEEANGVVYISPTATGVVAMDVRSAEFYMHRA